MLAACASLQLGFTAVIGIIHRAIHAFKLVLCTLYLFPPEPRNQEPDKTNLFLLPKSSALRKPFDNDGKMTEGGGQIQSQAETHRKTLSQNKNNYNSLEIFKG